MKLIKKINAVNNLLKWNDGIVIASCYIMTPIAVALTFFCDKGTSRVCEILMLMGAGMLLASSATLIISRFISDWKLLPIILAALLAFPSESRAEVQQTENVAVYAVAVCVVATLAGIAFYKMVCAARALPPRELPPEDEEKMLGSIIPDDVGFTPDPCYCEAPTELSPDSHEIEIEIESEGLAVSLRPPRSASPLEAQGINRLHRILNPIGPGLFARGGVTCNDEGTGRLVNLQQSLDCVNWQTIGSFRLKEGSPIHILDTFPTKGMSLYRAVMEEQP